MLITEKNLYIGQKDYSSATKYGLLGIPYDCTASFRPGSRFAPNAIRSVSESIETYSPRLDRDLEDLCYTDFGNVPCIFGDPVKNLNIISKYHKEIISKKIFLLGIGGEHLVTYPLVKNICETLKNKKLTVVDFDAHLDMREDYLGNSFSHATVMNLISKEKNVEKIIQIGTRSGTREEYKKRANSKKIKSIETPAQLDDLLKQAELVYLTIDIDVLDPSIMPGTGTPEAGGLTYNQLLDFLYVIKNFKVIGADLVELAPEYDFSGNSSVLAAKLLREILLTVGK